MGKGTEGRDIYTFGSCFSLFFHRFLRLYCSSSRICNCSVSLTSDSDPSESLNNKSYSGDVTLHITLKDRCTEQHHFTCSHLRSSVMWLKLYRQALDAVCLVNDTPVLRSSTPALQVGSEAKTSHAKKAQYKIQKALTLPLHCY